MTVNNTFSKTIANRTFQFSVNMIIFCCTLPKDEANRIIIRQLIRSTTSIGANIEEALGCKTRAEFIQCVNIAKKEARETLYWLKILDEINKNLQGIDDLLKESNEIVSILTKSIQTLQKYDRNKILNS